jgi:hypothetical protein
MSLVDQQVQLQNLMPLLHEEDLFISMAMEVHNASEDDMNCFIKECVHLFHDRQSKIHLPLSFCIQFFRQRVSIAL